MGIPALVERVCGTEGVDNVGCVTGGGFELEVEAVGVGIDAGGCGTVADLIGAVFDRAGRLSEDFDCDGPSKFAARCCKLCVVL